MLNYTLSVSLENERGDAEAPRRGNIRAMNATLQSLLWTLGLALAFFPIFFLIAYARFLGWWYTVLWGVYLGAFVLVRGIIEKRRSDRVKTAFFGDEKNSEKASDGGFIKYQ